MDAKKIKIDINFSYKFFPNIVSLINFLNIKGMMLWTIVTSKIILANVYNLNIFYLALK